MSSVLDDQPDVIFLRELDPSDYVFSFFDGDGVTDIITELTWLTCWCIRVARLILVVGIHDLSCDRLTVQSWNGLDQFLTSGYEENVLGLGEVPIWL